MSYKIFSDAVLSLSGAIVAILIAVLPATSLADTRLVAACRDEVRPIVTIGAPHAYKPLLGAMYAQQDSAALEIDQWTSCPAFAFGNDYQILDWLENGRIDAGILSVFAAEIVRTSQPDQDAPLYYIADAWPFPSGEFRRYRISLQLPGIRRDPQRIASDFDAVLGRLARDEAGDPSAIVVNSHLSSAFPVLIHYVADRLETLNLTSTTDLGEFWQRFFQHLRFRMTTAPVEGESFVTVSESDLSVEAGLVLTGENTIFQDIIVYDARLGATLFGAREPNIRKRFRNGAIQNWLDGHEQQGTGSGDNAIRSYLDSTYATHEAGFRNQRHFRFSLAELWPVIQEVGNDTAALVLTGGGVKAAYQTRLIDYLYGNKLLTNQAPPVTANAGVDSLKVDFVIGTSGGALLGLFVSGIDQPGNPELTRRLWEIVGEDRYVESYELFPRLEMPRYFTMLVSSLVLLLCVVIVRRIPFLRRRTDIVAIDPKFLSAEDNAHRLRPWYVWLVFLGVAPWVIRSVAGLPGLEHVPAIAGLCYFFCVLVAAYSDNRLLFKSTFSITNLQFRGLNLVLLLLGVLLIAVSLINKGFGSFSNEPLPLLGYIGTWTLLCSIGFGALAVSLHQAIASQSDDVIVLPRAYIGSAIVILVSIFIGAHAALSTLGITLFELTDAFWQAYLVWTVLITIAVLLLCYLPLSTRLSAWLRQGIDFLVSKPAAKSYLGGTMRLSRFVGFIFATFLWWNMIMAPAIYGNEQAKRFFANLYKTELCAQRDLSQADCDDLVLAEEPSLAPATPFVISATSLEKGAERYFFVHPDAYSDDCRIIPEIDQQSALYKLSKTDPRWRGTACHPKSQDVIDTVFASGSPFPVFPATRVPLGDSGETEWLVDGGYAHNVPIEAANALGARTVLVISSSPLHQDEILPTPLEELRFGNLSHNLTRLFPYLFERSQVEDAVRAQQSLVVTLSPTGGDPNDAWPTLTDFRSATVRRMIDEATRDIDERIGMVESWGPPDCEIGGVIYACSALATIRQSDAR